MLWQNGWSINESCHLCFLAKYFSTGNANLQDGISFFAKLLDKRSFFSLSCLHRISTNCWQWCLRIHEQTETPWWASQAASPPLTLTLPSAIGQSRAGSSTLCRRSSARLVNEFAHNTWRYLKHSISTKNQRYLCAWESEHSSKRHWEEKPNCQFEWCQVYSKVWKRLARQLRAAGFDENA